MESKFRIHSSGNEEPFKDFFSKGVMRHKSFWRKTIMVAMKRVDRKRK